MEKKTRLEILRYEEIIRIAQIIGELGIKKVRITGGEPLIRRDVVSLIEKISQMRLFSEITLTTNGTKLAEFSHQLKKAGLSRVNISLDSLDRERYFQITGGGKLNEVLMGIEEAIMNDLAPVKINVVAMKGVNEDEVEGFARLTIDRPLWVRFIEFMPISQHRNFWESRYLPSNVLKERLFNSFSLIPFDKVVGNGPAEYYQIKGAKGAIGLISPISNHFCAKCNRIRLTPDGKLRPCLGNEDEIELKDFIRKGVANEELKEIILQAIKNKPKAHHFNIKELQARQMVALGG
jgi:cyclic pyranopterin phosphate synthase